jgi:outer membrane protein OmpA-like peptidoglycan-associated protein
MKKLTSSFSLVLLLAGTAALAQPTQLKPAPERISDVAIQSDLDAYKTLQARIHRLNEQGVPVRDYHLSKAQCWLDVSLHEYTRNDRSAFPQAAMTESEKLIVALEKKITPLLMDTPLVNDAARLRPDLWARTASLKKDSGFQCAQQQVACAEVELVHAGNEHNQQQWRHAKPYVQIAEDLMALAESAASTCLPAPAVPQSCPVQQSPACVPAAALPEPAAALPAPAKVKLSAAVVFNFDRFTRPEMRVTSMNSLQELIRQATGDKVKVDAIRLIGHADRLNGTGNRNYNQELSRKRAETVRQMLVEAGLPATAVSYEFVGDTEQIVQCEGKYKNAAALQECLLPNRRVEVQLLGVRAP